MKSNGISQKIMDRIEEGFQTPDKFSVAVSVAGPSSISRWKKSKQSWIG